MEHLINSDSFLLQMLKQTENAFMGIKHKKTLPSTPPPIHSVLYLPLYKLLINKNFAS